MIPMPFKLRHGREIVTLFALIAGGIFLFLASVIAYNNNLFRGRVYYYTLVQDAYGLASLPPIYFKGFAVGRVKSFVLTPENTIRVDFYVFDDFQDRVIDYSVVSINTNPISGEITEFQLITPAAEGARGNILPAGSLVPDLKSATAQKYIADGHLKYEAFGIEGILDKTNQILKVFIEQKTSEKINGIIADAANMTHSLERTVKSYGPDGTGSGHKQVMGLLDNVNHTMKSVLESANFIKETIEVIHRNRKDLAPLILNTNKTLEKAQDTLDGINRNPLLKGGIKEDRRVHGIEMVQ